MKPITLLAALAPLTLGACATLFGPGSPFAVDRKGDLVEFTYAWSAEASRQPALARHLRTDLERAFAASATAATADRAATLAAGRKFVGHRYDRRWTTAGQSSRLLSLDGRLAVATGAGSTARADGLLWDRLRRREVRIDQLFTTSAAFDTLVRLPGCARLERACAAPRDLTVVVGDSDRNRRFDHLRVAATGGNGRATIADERLAVSAAMLAAINPAYRASFEVGQSPQ
jgi:hypothetical protein